SASFHGRPIYGSKATAQATHSTRSVTTAALLRTTPRTSNEYQGTAAPPGFELPSFSLIDYRGHRVSSSGLQGRVVVMTFLDSKCTDACPLVASVVARAVEQLDADQRGVAVIALSVNPDADIPARVRAFLSARHATGRIDY